MSAKVALDDYFGVLRITGVNEKAFKELIATNAADLYYWNALQETASYVDLSDAFEVQRSMQHNINVTLAHKFVTEPLLNEAIKQRWLEIISQNKPQKSVGSGGVLRPEGEDESDSNQRRRRGGGGQGPEQLIEVEEASSDDEDDSNLFAQRKRLEQERLRKQQEQRGGAAPGGSGFVTNFNYEDILRNLQKMLLDSALPSELELLVFPPLFVQHASSVAKSKRKFTFQTVKGPMQSINETISLEPSVRVFVATEDDEATELAPLDEMYERFLDTLKKELKQRAAMFKMPRIKIFDFKRTPLASTDAPPPLTPEEVFGSPIKKTGFVISASNADKKKTAQKTNDLIYLDKLFMTDVKFDEYDLLRIQKKPKSDDQVEVQIQSWVHARFSEYVKEKLERRKDTGVIVILPMDAQIEDSTFEQLTESLFSLSYYDEVTKAFTTSEPPTLSKLGLGECNLLSIVPISTFFVDVPNSVSSADPKKLTNVDYLQIESTTIPRKLKVALGGNIAKMNLWSNRSVLKIAKPALMLTTTGETITIPVVAVSKSALKNDLSLTLLLQKLSVDGLTEPENLYQNSLHSASMVLDQSWNAVAKAIADGYAKQSSVIAQVRNYRVAVEATQKKIREEQKKMEEIQKQKEEQDRKKQAEELAEEERQRAKRKAEEEELKKKGKSEETPEEAEQRRRKEEQDEIDRLNATFSSSKSRQRSSTTNASETLISFSDSSSSSAPPPSATGRSTATTTITPVSNNNNSKFGDSSVIQRLSDF